MDVADLKTLHARLDYVQKMLATQRFAGCDQNPKGIRDLLGLCVTEVGRLVRDAEPPKHTPVYGRVLEIAVHELVHSDRTLHRSATVAWNVLDTHVKDKNILHGKARDAFLNALLEYKDTKKAVMAGLKAAGVTRHD